MAIVGESHVESSRERLIKPSFIPLDFEAVIAFSLILSNFVSFKEYVKLILFSNCIYFDMLVTHGLLIACHKDFKHLFILVLAACSLDEHEMKRGQRNPL